MKLPWLIFQYSVIRPGSRVAGHFHTHAEAITHAQKQARKATR